MNVRAIIATLVLSLALAAAGCSSPPPALPAAVLKKGLEAVTDDHPEMPAEQLEACGECHRTSDAPTP